MQERWTCEYCGQSFEQTHPGRKKKYCSEECRRAADKARQLKRAKLSRKQLVCQRCGKEFTGARRNQKYCSRECLQRRHPKPIKKRCELCGKPFVADNIAASRQRFCSKPCARQWWLENRDKGKLYTYVCQNCGKEYQTPYSNRDTCCSRECGWEWISKQAEVEKECLSCGQPFTEKGSGPGYCSEECQDRGRRKTCETCGAVFYGKRNASYCSEECRPPTDSERKRQYTREYGQRSKGNPLHVCRECGKRFRAPYGDKRRSFCSSGCCRRFNGRIHKRKRRAYKKTNGPIEAVNPLLVYERDSWICSICGKKVDKRLMFPDPASPSLDHIVPLSQGGPHTYQNVQLAHLRCNMVKGARAEGQLRLGLIR